MARALIAAHHAGFMNLAKPGADPEAWLAAQTSLRLKGLLWNAVESSPVPMMLDGITGAGFPTYRFLQRIYHTRGMALFAASRDAVSLGALARLLWDRAMSLSIPPLSARDAEELFETAAGHFNLRHLGLDEFREKVLESARGNPGQIIEMCRLATQPQHHAGRHIKFSPLRIDTVNEVRTIEPIARLSMAAQSRSATWKVARQEPYTGAANYCLCSRIPVFQPRRTTPVISCKATP
jgi:hypothetical protein